MYILMTGTGYVQIINSFSRIHTTRKKSLAKSFYTYEEADEYRSNSKSSTIIKIKHTLDCSELFTIEMTKTRNIL